MKFFGVEKITKLQKVSSDIVQLPAGSFLRIGGQGYRLSSSLNLNRTVTGVEGLQTAVANLTFYYVYAILDSGVVKLIGSTSSDGPSGYSAFRKVGAFYTDSVGLTFKAYFIGEVIPEVYSAYLALTTGTAFQQAPFDWVTSSGTTTKTGVFLPNIFCQQPNASYTPAMNSYRYGNIIASTSGFTAQVYRADSNTVEDRAGYVSCYPSGIDAIQPIWD